MRNDARLAFVAAEPTSPARETRADLQVLRAVAVVAVVVFHAWPSVLPGGFLGVDVFFVISGFLVGGALVREAARTGRIDVLGFAAKRIRRLVPAASAVIVGTIVAAALWWSPLGMSFHARGRATIPLDALAASTGLTNVWLLVQRRDYQDDGWGSPYTHFWSLGAEWQFYAVAPLLALAVGWFARRGNHARRRLLVGTLAIEIVAIVWMLAIEAAKPEQVFFHPVARLFELWLGVVLAVWTDNDARPFARVAVPASPQARSLAAVIGLTREDGLAMVRRWAAPVGFLAIAGASGISVGSHSWPDLGLVFALAGTVLVVAAHPRCRGPWWRPFTFLGDVSYALYLVHWPVLVLAPRIVDRPLSAVDVAVAVGVSFGFAVALHYGIERPAQHLTLAETSIKVKAVALAGAAPLVVLAVSGLAVIKAESTLSVTHENAQYYEPTTLGDWVPRRVVPDNVQPGLEYVRDDQQRSAYDGCEAVFGEPQPDEPCIYGNPDGPITVVLWGDSQAQQWLEALVNVPSANMRIVAVTARGCPPIADLTPFDRPEWCDAWQEWSQAAVEAAHADVVLISARLDYEMDASPDQYASGTRSTLDALQVDAPVLWIAQAPHYALDPVDCLAENIWNTTPCSVAREEALHPRAEAAVMTEVDRAGATWVDLNNYACGDFCEPVLGDVIVMRDFNHFTATFSARMAPVIEGVVTDALASETTR